MENSRLPHRRRRPGEYYYCSHRADGFRKFYGLSSHLFSELVVEKVKTVVNLNDSARYHATCHPFRLILHLIPLFHVHTGTHACTIHKETPSRPYDLRSKSLYMISVMNSRGRAAKFRHYYYHKQLFTTSI